MVSDVTEKDEMNNLEQDSEAITGEEDLKKDSELVKERSTEDEECEDSKSESKEDSKTADSSEDSEFKKKYYYVAAELDNQRKRFERERETLIKYGNEKVLSSLIEVVDNFDHSIEALGKEADDKVRKIIEGVEMIRGQFLDVLRKSGLERIEAHGKQFDPNYHEAMAQQPMEGKEDGEIVLEYQKGYILNGRLLRPSKVVVAKAMNVVDK